MTAARSFASYRRARAHLSESHLEQIRALVRTNSVRSVERMLGCSQHLFAEIRSGGFAMPATIARIGAALDALRGGST